MWLPRKIEAVDESVTEGALMYMWDKDNAQQNLKTSTPGRGARFEDAVIAV